MEYDGVAIGNKIYSARMNKNLSQAEVGETVGIHQTTYSKLENGKYDIPLSQLIKLCECLDITFDWLIGKSEVTFTGEELHEIEKFKKYIIGTRKK